MCIRDSYQPDPTQPYYHPSKTVLLSDFAGNGLDSANAEFGGYPAAAYGVDPAKGSAFAGKNPLFGQVSIVSPMGRSVYNGLQASLRQGTRIPVRGVKGSNFEVSYTLSRFLSSAGGSEAVSYTHLNCPKAKGGVHFWYKYQIFYIFSYWSN